MEIVRNKIVEKAANYYGNDFDYDSSVKLLEDYTKDKPITETKT